MVACLFFAGSTAQAINWGPLGGGKGWRKQNASSPTGNQSRSQPAQDGQSQSKGRPISRRVKAVIGLGLLGAGLSAAGLGWYHWGQPLTLNAFRGPMAAHLSHLSGQHVSIDGPMGIAPGGRTGFDLVFRADELKVGNASVGSAMLGLGNLGSKGPPQATLKLDGVDVRVVAGGQAEPGILPAKLPRLPATLRAFDLTATATKVRVHYTNPVKGHSIEGWLNDVALVQQRGQPTQLVLGGGVDGISESRRAPLAFWLEASAQGSLPQLLSASTPMDLILSGGIDGVPLSGKAHREGGRGSATSTFELNVGEKNKKLSEEAPVPPGKRIRGPAGWTAETVRVQGALRGGDHRTQPVQLEAEIDVSGVHGRLPTASGDGGALVEGAEFQVGLGSGKATRLSARGQLGKHEFVLKGVETATLEQLAQLAGGQAAAFKTRFALTLGAPEGPGPRLSFDDIMGWAGQSKGPSFPATAGHASLTGTIPYAGNIEEAMGGATLDLRIDGVEATLQHPPSQVTTELRKGTIVAHADPAAVSGTVTGTVKGQPLEVHVSRSATMAQLVRWFRGEAVHLKTSLNGFFGHKAVGKPPIRFEDLCAWVGVEPPVDHGTARLIQFDGTLAPGGSREQMLSSLSGKVSGMQVSWVMPHPRTDRPVKVKLGQVSSQLQPGKPVALHAKDGHWGDVPVAEAELFASLPLDALIHRPDAPFKLGLHTKHLDVIFDVGAGVHEFAASVDGKGPGFEALLKALDRGNLGKGLLMGEPPPIETFDGTAKWTPKRGLELEDWTVGFGPSKLAVDARYESGRSPKGTKKGRPAVWDAKVRTRGELDLVHLDRLVAWTKTVGADESSASGPQHALASLLAWAEAGPVHTTLKWQVGRLLYDEDLWATDGKVDISLHPTDGGTVAFSFNTPSGTPEGSGHVKGDLEFGKTAGRGVARATLLADTAFEPFARGLKRTFPALAPYLQGDAFPGNLKFRSEVTTELSDPLGKLSGWMRSAVWPIDFRIIPFDRWLGLGAVEAIFDLGDAALGNASQEQSEVVCAGSAVQWKNGQGVLRRGVVSTKEVDLSVEGRANLVEGTVNAVFEPDVRHGAGKLELLRLALPVYIEGSLHDRTLTHSVAGKGPLQWFDAAMRTASSLIGTPVKTAVNAVLGSDGKPCQGAMDYEPSEVTIRERNSD